MNVSPHDWLRTIGRAPEEAGEGWEHCAGMAKDEAEQFLDWLEVHGYARREVRYEEGRGFAVRWRKG
jgi:hypothetical protein